MIPYENAFLAAFSKAGILISENLRIIVKVPRILKCMIANTSVCICWEYVIYKRFLF